MIAGPNFGQANIRRYLYHFHVISVGDKVKYDAFEAIAASLYTEGKFDTKEDDRFSHQEMTLELGLNVIAFYWRCAHFPFILSLLKNWSILAIQEYEYAVSNEIVNGLGLSTFNSDLEDFEKDHLDWNHNFKALANCLFTAKIASPNHPLWMDVYALQLLFYEKKQTSFLYHEFRFCAF
jgi:hypothetical protein